MTIPRIGVSDYFYIVLLEKLIQYKVHAMSLNKQFSIYFLNRKCELDIKTSWSVNIVSTDWVTWKSSQLNYRLDR